MNKPICFVVMRNGHIMPPGVHLHRENAEATATKEEGDIVALYASPPAMGIAAQAQEAKTFQVNIDEDSIRDLIALAADVDDVSSITLSIGIAIEDDGSEEYGLRASLSDYPDEGVIMLAELSRPLPAQASGEAEDLAQLFHETYEKLSPQFGYETRKESAKPWIDVPENNRKLMIAVCAEIQRHQRQAVRPYMRHLEDCELVRFRNGYYSPSETKCPPCSCGLERVLWNLPADNQDTRK